MKTYTFAFAATDFDPTESERHADVQAMCESEAWAIIFCRLQRLGHTLVSVRRVR